MKLATYDADGQTSFGMVTRAGVCDLPSMWPGEPATLADAIAGGPELMHRLANVATLAAHCVPWDALRLRAPLPAPGKLIGIAVNYVEHHREFDRDADLPDDPRRTTTPRPFLMPPTCVADPGSEIPWPIYSEEIDYEVELAAVIGRPCRAVTPDEALDCLAGYTIANDVSARSVTHARGREPRPKDAFFDWLHGKWADAVCPLGPWIVTPDELGDPQDLAIDLSVNGQTRQQARTDQMIFSVAELIAFCSQLMTLLPGDVIATGTPSGVGKATGRLLEPGDVITCRIERIGEMTHTLGPRPERFYTPCLT